MSKRQPPDDDDDEQKSIKRRLVHPEWQEKIFDYAFLIDEDDDDDNINKKSKRNDYIQLFSSAHDDVFQYYRSPTYFTLQNLPNYLGVFVQLFESRLLNFIQKKIQLFPHPWIIIVSNSHLNVKTLQSLACVFGIKMNFSFKFKVIDDLMPTTLKQILRNRGVQLKETRFMSFIFSSFLEIMDFIKNTINYTL